MSQNNIYLCLDNTLDYSGDPKTQSIENELAGIALWPYPTLYIRFLDGLPTIQQQVKRYALEWTKYAGISFVFLENTEFSHIRITFEEKGVSWSRLGSHAIDVAQDKPTMNFGWLDQNTPICEIRRVVLHEFGHALGFAHEHQSPNFQYTWDETKVYEHFGKMWTREQIKANILDKNPTLPSERPTISRFDKNSIMVYAIPSGLLLEGHVFARNTELSREDKRWAQKCYPKETEKDWMVKLSTAAGVILISVGLWAMRRH